MAWTNQNKNTSSFIDGVKQFLISFLLWTDTDGSDGGYLVYTDGSGGEGRIILEDHSFADLPKHPSLFTNQVKH